MKLKLPRFGSFGMGFVLIALATVVAQSTDWMALAHAKLLDVAFIVARKISPEPVKRDVAVIGIDVDDLREFSDPRDFWHAHYGELLAALAKARPAVGGVDVVFPERSYQQLIPGLDQALLRGLPATPAGQVPVVLARTVDDFKNFREIFAPYVAIAGSEQIGSVVVCKDDDEGIRRFDEYLCDPQRTEAIPSLAGVMAKRMGVEQSWRGWIDYRIGEPVQYVPFRNVVHWAQKEDPQLQSALGGRPVLLGFILPFEDRKSVPVDLAQWEPGNLSVPGVLVHAQILRSMLNGGLLQPLAMWWIYAAALLGAAFVLLRATTWTAAAYVAYVALLGAATLVLLKSGWFFESAGPMMAATAAVGGRFVNDAIAHA